MQKDHLANTDAYRDLTQQAAAIPLERSVLQLSGKDRVEFLQNMTTNDFRRLEHGQGCEAFATNAQGKIVALVSALIENTRVMLVAEPGAAQRLTRHFDRFVIREDVVFDDLSSTTFHWLISGAQAAQRLCGAGFDVPESLLQHRRVGDDGRLVRYPWGPAPSFLLQCPAATREAWSQRLDDAAIPQSPAHWAEVLRVEGGTPLYGTDITDANLPQEINRNERAISFTKGCYLGQETVARIDALGHVNWILCGLKFPGHELPRPGAELTRDGKILARITSSVFSPTLQAPLALAYVRSAQAQAGQRLPASPEGHAEAEVEVLPLPVQ